MQLHALDHGLDLNAPTAGYSRTPGLHMSTIYNSLWADMYPDKYGDNGKGPDETKMSLGTSFEEVLEPALAHRLTGERPGEFATQHDGLCIHARTPVKVGDSPCPCGAGVIYSPDQLFFNGHMTLGEFKCTWYSIRQGITDPKFDKWFCQMKAYCYHLDTLHARLFVLFVNGDYSYKPPHGGPHVRAWDITFTQLELNNNWRMLHRHATKKGMWTNEVHH